MALRQFSLIGVDSKGNKHPFFSERAASIGKAADLALEENTSFLQILNGDQAKHSDNNYYLKPIRARPNIGGDRRATLLGQALTEAQRNAEAHRLETARLVISNIESKGFTLVTVEVEESLEVRTLWLSHKPEIELSEADAVLIADHRETIISVLQERPMTEKKKPTKKKIQASTQQKGLNIDVDAQDLTSDEVRAILAELPQKPFLDYEFLCRLRKRQLHDLADNTAKVTEILERSVEQGLLRKKRDKVYEFPNLEAVSPTTNLNEGIQTPPQIPQTSSVVGCQSPAEPCKVEPPKPEAPKPEPMLLDQPTQTLMPSHVGTSAVNRLMASLVTTALADERPSLADALDAAIAEFNDAILSATTSFEDRIKPVIGQLRKEEQLRKALSGRILEGVNL